MTSRVTGATSPDTEEQEADEVRCRIAFGPFEVDVRQSVGAGHAQLSSRAASAFGTLELLRVRTRYRPC